MSQNPLSYRSVNQRIEVVKQRNRKGILYPCEPKLLASLIRCFIVYVSLMSRNSQRLVDLAEHAEPVPFWRQLCSLGLQLGQRLHRRPREP